MSSQNVFSFRLTGFLNGIVNIFLRRIDGKQEGLWYNNHIRKTSDGISKMMERNAFIMKKMTLS